MRKLIWINGSQSWCAVNAQALISCLPGDTLKIIYCGSDSQTLTKHQININASSKRGNIEHYLGTECSALIFNCFNGFNPELFCALSGTVQSPGVIILMSPPEIEWPSYPDPDALNLCSYPFSEKDIKGRFIHYFIHKLKKYNESESVISISENDYSGDTFERIQAETKLLFSISATDKVKPVILSEQQERVIRLVKTILNNDTSTVLILSGKRGRGKSSILGVALNAYAANFYRKITVCVVSQTRSNIVPLIKQLCHQESKTFINKMTHRSLSLTYYPPDELLKAKQEIDLLIVDEAAAIPLPQLYRILDSYKKIVLSTTTDGYEGTGKGFNYKLIQRLAGQKRQVSHLQLTQSLRWSENDPIEKFLHESLLLDQSDCSAMTEVPVKLKLDDFKFEKVDRDNLITDMQTIDALFSLLSSAHYRTTPDDLRYMLDAPEIEIWTAHHNKTIYAAMMVSREGGLPEELAEDIWLGFRRLRGHLIPQYISAQCGFKSACTYHFKRILRIAVWKPYQKIGIGRCLVSCALENETTHKELDCYGVSFGYQDELFGFWKTLGFLPVKLGFRRNARSGQRSVNMLWPVSDRGIQLLTSLHQRFCNEIDFASSLRTSDFHTDPAGINNSSRSGPEENLLKLREYGLILPAFSLNSSSIRLKQSAHHPHVTMGTAAIPRAGQTACQNFADDEIDTEAQDELDIFSFAFGHRQFADCHWVLSKYANLCLNTNARRLFCTGQIKLLTFKILQNKSWKNCTDLLGYTGKKQAMTNLRRVFAIIYKATWGNKS